MQPENQQNQEQQKPQQPSAPIYPPAQAQGRILSMEVVNKNHMLYRRLFVTSLIVLIVSILGVPTYVFLFIAPFFGSLTTFGLVVLSAIATIVFGVLSRTKTHEAINEDGSVAKLPHSVKSTLNIMLYGLIVGVAAILGFGGLIILAVQGGPVGSGDMILLLIPLIFGVGCLSIVYVVAGWITIIRSRFKHRFVPARHFIAVPILTLLSFIPYVGPGWYFGASISNSFIEPAVQSYKDSQYKGPTEAQKAAVQMGTFDEVRQRINDCYVYEIQYKFYDLQGPYKRNNLYIQVGMQGHVSYNIDNTVYIPPDVNLPIADNDKLAAAITEKNKHLNGAFASCKEEISFSNDLPKD